MVPEVIDVITVMRTCTSRRKQQLNVFTFWTQFLIFILYVSEDFRMLDIETKTHMGLIINNCLTAFHIIYQMLK